MRTFSRSIKDNEIDRSFRRVEENAQDKQFDVSTSALATTNVGEKEFKLYYTGSELRLYTKYNGTLYYVVFT